MAPKYNNKKKGQHKARDRRVAGFDEIEARNRGEEPLWMQKKKAEEEEEEEEEPEVFQKAEGNTMASAMIGIMGTGDEVQDEAPQLSRKQREEMEKERKKRNYEAAHARGETDEAKSDLERLRKIREARDKAKADREEVAKKQKEVEEAAKAKASSGNAYVNALGGEKAGTGKSKTSKKKVATSANQMDDFQDKVFMEKKKAEEKAAAASIEALAGSIDACRLAEDDFM